MNRRQTLELSLLGAAAAIVTACGGDNNKKAPSDDLSAALARPAASGATGSSGSSGSTGSSGGADRKRRRAHALGMFLLALNDDYRNHEIITNTTQDNLPTPSLLHKVRPDVFLAMREFFIQTQSQIGPDALNSIMRAIRDFSRQAANHKLSTAALTVADAPYTSPDECPCLVDNSCPEVEALLAL
jgi:hypothetical protein